MLTVPSSSSRLFMNAPFLEAIPSDSKLEIYVGSDQTDPRKNVEDGE
jgi:hypothetical protein